MKFIFILFLSIITLTTFSQVDSTNKYDVFSTDSITKQRYIGLNIGTFIGLISNPNLSVKTTLLFIKLRKATEHHII